MGLPVVGLLTKGVSHGIGLVGEAIQANRSKPTNPTNAINESQSVSTEYPIAPPAYDSAETQSRVGRTLEQDSDIDAQHELKSKDTGSKSTFDGEDSDSSLEDLDEEWALDEASSEIAASNSEVVKAKRGFGAQPTVESLVAVVVSLSPQPTSINPPLRCPVILPQRRPGSQDRGFIRAYASDLAEKGISPDAFQAFLTSFDAAAQASPILTVVYLSAGVVGFVPHTAAIATSAVVQVAAGAAIKYQKRQRTNSYLDQINEAVFKPRGLYALIMSYVPGGQRPVEAQQVDVASIISKREEAEGGWRDGFRKTTSGDTYEDLEMPEAAPLVFPALDEAGKSDGAAEPNALKKTGKAITNYYDRRAQAIYTARNPNSSLKYPEEQQQAFASRFSDPNHAVNSGSIVALVTGGSVNPNKQSMEKKQAKQARKETRRQHKGRSPSKRSMRKNVLYLMIVNLPTDEELVVAEERLQSI